MHGFDTAAYLRRATGRAKSDVANKLVSMFLHDISRKLCAHLRLSVADLRYAGDVANTFGPNCCYCEKLLENDRAAVEHLDGMNRFRMGLHIPGNVVVACTRCNREKRRDDSAPQLKLAQTGWESFLLHTGEHCASTCKSCGYWSKVWPSVAERIEKMASTTQRIRLFRGRYTSSLEASAKARTFLAAEIEKIYRDCQDFATTRLKESVDGVLRKLII
jgi:hypothetical protein